MPVDESEFFREATLRICGDLDIEKALARFLQYLRAFMPADRLVLERFDEESGVAKVVAHATPERGARGDALTPLSKEARKHIRWMYRRGPPEPYYENSPNEHPPARELLAFHGQEASAFLELPLVTRDGCPGAVVLLAERGRYNDAHLRLLSLLKAPFQVALANALQHAEIVELKDALAADNSALLARHTRTYLSLRKAVGLIGILMPFTLMLGNRFIYQGELVLRSISRYYHSDMRNFFVAALCAMALFLFFYSGYDWRERWAAIFAGVLSLGVAFFPTTLEGPTDLTGKLHYTCALLLFLLLAWISLFHFPKKPPGVAKRATDRIQVLCGLLMIACVLSIVIYYAFIRVESLETCFVFVAETVALVAFGVSWFTEGLDLERVIA
jgi:GAF domain-containing protein